MTIGFFARDDLARSVWKNGGGSTREIVRMPPDSTMDSFAWRVSIADVNASGPFSTYAGVDRVIVLLSGAGARLKSDDGAIDHMLDQPFVPYAFAGEHAIEAALIAGACSDFNVMTRRATARADVAVLSGEGSVAESSAGVLFAARGTWTARADRDTAASRVLSANCGMWWWDERMAWDVAANTDGGVLIVVRIVDASRGYMPVHGA